MFYRGLSVRNIISVLLLVGIAGPIFLFFIGFGILLFNLFSVPVPTSMMTVGTIVGKDVSLDALTADQDPPVAELGEAEPQMVVEEAGSLFDRRALARYVSMWIVGPSVALTLSYAYSSVGLLGG